MPKRFTRWLTLGVALAVCGAAVAAAEEPTVIEVGDLIVTIDGSYSPRELPKNERAAISLDLSGKVETRDAGHPPPMVEFVFEADRNAAIDVEGLPVCTAGKLQAKDTQHAQAACPDAIVGVGKTDAQVAFLEQAPFIAKSKLLAFNGGFSGGVTTIFFHAYLAVPVSVAVVTTAKVSEISKGRFGIRSVTTIPKIAGGYGSVLNFELKFSRIFEHAGKKQSYIALRCPDGKVFARGTVVFKDGTSASGGVIRACVARD